MSREVWGDLSRPAWLTRFCHRVLAAIQTEEDFTTVGCHTHQFEEDETPEWEVTLFLSRDESEFGYSEFSDPPQFMLNLRAIVTVFDAITNFYWQSDRLAEDDQIGAHVGVTGEFEEHRVWLRVAARAPDEFGQDSDIYSETTDDRC